MHLYVFKNESMSARMRACLWCCAFACMWVVSECCGAFFDCALQTNVHLSEARDLPLTENVERLSRMAFYDHGDTLRLLFTTCWWLTAFFAVATWLSGKGESKERWMPAIFSLQLALVLSLSSILGTILVRPMMPYIFLGSHVVRPVPPPPVVPFLRVARGVFAFLCLAAFIWSLAAALWCVHKKHCKQ